MQGLCPIDAIGTPVLAIEASYFMDQFLHPQKEPLVPALGGFPMALEGQIVKKVRDIEATGCKIWFYFDGLKGAWEQVPITRSTHSAKLVAEAFEIYEASEAVKAIETFKQSGMSA